ncbi:MAG TPA: baseplate J/gp47 family protein, partial [Devosia sp.]|nr:baseplate J/gp47 family protein [Devosia sp.]
MAAYDYLTGAGVIVPDTSETLAQVQQMHRDAWGADVLLDPETPLGKIVTSDTLILDTAARSLAEGLSMFNPEVSEYAALDALGAAFRIYRRPATPSIISAVTLSGVPNTVIPSGSICIDTNGVRWSIDGNRLIPPSGSIVATATCTEPGPIECPIGELNKIAPESAVLGWETVSNTVAASPGRLQETNAEFRRRRRRMLALNSSSSLAAIDAALWNIQSVRSITRRENYTNVPAVIDGIPMVANSIWYCVEGGTDEEVAFAIMSKKDPGANFNGALTVPITDPSSGQIYQVKFDRPTPIPVWVRFTVAPVALDVDAICKDATMAYADGTLEGNQG